MTDNHPPTRASTNTGDEIAKAALRLFLHNGFVTNIFIDTVFFFQIIVDDQSSIIGQIRVLEAP